MPFSLKQYPLELPLRLLIALISVLIIGSVLAITINPIEFVRFKRDRQRVFNLRDLSSLINQIQAQSAEGAGRGQSLVYVSLPDNDPNCSNWKDKGLPPLSNGFSYRCAAESTYRNIDGSGWIPFNLKNLPGNTFKKLPVDPRNGEIGLDPDRGKKVLYFYQFIMGSVFLQAVGGMESEAGLRQLSEIQVDKEMAAMRERLSSGISSATISGSIANTFFIASGSDAKEAASVLKKAVEVTAPAIREAGITPSAINKILDEVEKTIFAATTATTIDLLPESLPPEPPPPEPVKIPSIKKAPMVEVVEVEEIIEEEKIIPGPEKPKFSQTAYRWFENDNSLKAGNPLTIIQNVPATAPLPPFRLRLAIGVMENYEKSDNKFKLQFARRSLADNDCNDGFSGEDYQDLSLSAGEIRFYNTPIADGSLIQANIDDPYGAPSAESSTAVLRSYQESNPFADLNIIGKNNFGVWDFSLVNHSASAGSSYCFRAVFDDNYPLYSYLIIPEINIKPFN